VKSVNKKLEQQFDEELGVEDILSVSKSSASTRRAKPEAPKKFSKAKDKEESFVFENELDAQGQAPSQVQGLYADLAGENGLFYYTEGKRC
jgi:hypothetical protein